MKVEVRVRGGERKTHRRNHIRWNIEHSHRDNAPRAAIWLEILHHDIFGPESKTITNAERKVGEGLCDCYAGANNEIIVPGAGKTKLDQGCVLWLCGDAASRRNDFRN